LRFEDQASWAAPIEAMAGAMKSRQRFICVGGFYIAAA
jgi:hypothetical protein